MVLYTVSSRQFILNTILLSILVSICVVGYFELKEYRSLPKVVATEGKCTQVINYNNGDAYNCNDVDVVLRRYRVKKN